MGKHRPFSGCAGELGRAQRRCGCRVAGGQRARGQGCLTRRGRHREDVCFCSSWMCLREGWERLLSLVGWKEGWQGRDKAPDKFGLAGELIS